MEFGDIMLAAGGLYSSKPRPVLIFQNSGHTTGESVIVIPFTSQENAEAYYRVPVKPAPGNGLDRQCWLEVDKVSAIRRSSLDRLVGVLDGDTVAKVVQLARGFMSPQ